MDGLVGYGQEPAIGALDALDGTLVAQSPRPFVGAGWLVSGFPGLPALEPAGIDVIPSPEKGAEQGNLGFGRGKAGDGIASRTHLDRPFCVFTFPATGGRLCGRNGRGIGHVAPCFGQRTRRDIGSVRRNRRGRPDRPGTIPIVARTPRLVQVRREDHAPSRNERLPGKGAPSNTSPRIAGHGNKCHRNWGSFGRGIPARRWQSHPRPSISIQQPGASYSTFPLSKISLMKSSPMARRSLILAGERISKSSGNRG